MDVKQLIAEANRRAAACLTDNDPYWVDIKPAGECVEGLEDHMILHSGPPVDYEDMVMLHKRGIPTRYFKRRNNTQEIEFLIERDQAVAPVEVKSSRGATTSLNAFIEQFKPLVAYKLTAANMGQEGCKRTLPHFMAMFL